MFLVKAWSAFWSYSKINMFLALRHLKRRLDHGHQLRMGGQGRKCMFLDFLDRSLQTNGWTDGRTDRRTDGQSLLQSCVSATKFLRIAGFNLTSFELVTLATRTPLLPFCLECPLKLATIDIFGQRYSCTGLELRLGNNLHIFFWNKPNLITNECIALCGRLLRCPTIFIYVCHLPGMFVMSSQCASHLQLWGGANKSHNQRPLGESLPGHQLSSFSSFFLSHLPTRFPSVTSATGAALRFS